MRRLTTIALALGEERTRSELIPFLKGEKGEESSFFVEILCYPLANTGFPILFFQTHLRKKMRFYKLLQKKYFRLYLLRLFIINSLY